MSEEDWERLEGSECDQPEFRACQSETGRIIREAVSRLPERQRLVFILRHYKLMSINEIAQTIGCTSGAVKAHLSRGTANLRDRLKGTCRVCIREGWTKMKCRHVREMMGAYLYGDLDADDMREVRMHTQECVDCKEDLESRGRVISSLATPRRNSLTPTGSGWRGT